MRHAPANTSHALPPLPTHRTTDASMLLPSRPDGWVNRQQHGQQARRTQAIINTNLKTELCRNHLRGHCTYGDRCAFAHGREELKYRTLREMQNAGRIPDAVKYRCIPCMTWVATGSCPYSSRCVFIHDPRVQGRQEAWLYAGSHMSSAYHSSDSAFFFPDLPRDPDSMLPRDSSMYDLDPAMSAAEDHADRAVYNMWYSFVSVLTGIETNKTTNNGGNAKSKMDAGFAASSPPSSESTVSLSDRSSSFGSNFSTSPTNSNTSGSSSAFTVCDFRDPGATRGGGASLANEHHQVAEHRLARGCCPRLPSFVGLATGVPTVTSTPTSPCLGVAGISLEEPPAISSWRGNPVMASRYLRTMELPPPSTVDSPPFMPPTDYRASSPQLRAGAQATQRGSFSTVDYCCSSPAATLSAPPRPPPPSRGTRVISQANANADEQRRHGGVTSRPVFVPSVHESIDRRDYRYQRDVSMNARRVPCTAALLHAVVRQPESPQFTKNLTEPGAQYFRVYTGFSQPPGESWRHGPERMHMWALDHSLKGSSAHRTPLSHGVKRQ